MEIETMMEPKIDKELKATTTEQGFAIAEKIALTDDSGEQLGWCSFHIAWKRNNEEILKSF